MEHDGTCGCLGKWIYSTIKASTIPPTPAGQGGPRSLPWSVVMWQWSDFRSLGISGWNCSARARGVSYSKPRDSIPTKDVWDCAILKISLEYYSRSDLLSFVWKLVLLKKVPLDQGVSVCVPITATKPILKVRTIAVPNPRRSNHQKKGFTIWSCRLHKKNATYFCHLFPASLERGIYIISKKRIPSWPSRVMSTLANKIGSFPQVDGKGHGYGPDGSWW